MAWWGWTILGLVGWTAIAVLVAIGLGRTIREAESRARCAACGHTTEAHLHYRGGTYCSLCDCPGFLAAGSRAKPAMRPLPPRDSRGDEERNAG